MKKIAKGLIKAQKADKENYMPFNDQSMEKKQLKGLKINSRPSMHFGLGIGLNQEEELLSNNQMQDVQQDLIAQP